ncbi:MAG: SDR family oxidoreductase [Vicingaceae bacterium]
MYSSAYHKNDISNFRFLITGGAGFIGSHLVEYLMLHNAQKVIVVDDLSTGVIQNIEKFLDKDSFSFIHGDINDSELMYDACTQVDFVLHQAALGSVPRSIEFPLDSHHANATGFLNVLEACRKTGIKRLVYASSSSVYGDSAELPKTEAVLGSPKSPYAVSKLVDELYASVYSSMHEMELIGLRYFNIFGPRQLPEGPYAAAIPLFILAALSGQQPTVYGDGEQSRDFTFVANAVKANMLALFAPRESCGTQYNVACGRQYSLNRILSLLNTMTSGELSSKHMKAREGDIRHSLADISKIEKTMKYKVDVFLEEGLKATFEWYRDVYLRSTSSNIGQ